MDQMWNLPFGCWEFQSKMRHRFVCEICRMLLERLEEDPDNMALLQQLQDLHAELVTAAAHP
jgi:transcription initiation factor IIE alpha subunit